MIPLPPDLEELYANVCEKRPECAIEGLLFERFFWTHPQCQGAIKEAAAAALIFAHWSMVLMKAGHSICTIGTVTPFTVYEYDYGIPKRKTGWYSDPLSAMAEYFLKWWGA